MAKPTGRQAAARYAGVPNARVSGRLAPEAVSLDAVPGVLLEGPMAPRPNTIGNSDFYDAEVHLYNVHFHAAAAVPHTRPGARHRVRRRTDQPMAPSCVRRPARSK